MEFYQLKYFVKVAETEHMTRAAEELNLSEPTLSRAIRQLERELETKLFERRGRSLALTESGQVLLYRAREILKDMDGLESEVKGAHQTLQPVRLVARAASCLIPNLLTEFTKQYPEISVSVIQNDNHVIRSEEYDLMISGSFIQPPKYSSTILLDDPFEILLSKDHPLASKEVIDVHQLDGLTMVGLAPNRFISSVVYQFLADHEVKVHHQVYSDDALMIRNLVERGLGFAFAPVFTFRPEDKECICTRPIANGFPPLHLVLSWKPNTYHPESVRIFRRFIQEYFQKLNH
ncbi:MAG: LysR family transcriptional regulator [Firmicutes bacterium]|nr:LysR family transcriptional regulator [Bacillota bacterium]